MIRGSDPKKAISGVRPGNVSHTGVARVARPVRGYVRCGTVRPEINLLTFVRRFRSAAAPETPGSKRERLLGPRQAQAVVAQIDPRSSQTSSGTISKRSTSTRPRSVIFSDGITDSARKLSVMNGAATSTPSSRQRVQRASSARRPPRRRRVGHQARRPAARSSPRTAPSSIDHDAAADLGEPRDAERHVVVGDARRRRCCARRARPSWRTRRAAGRSRARSPRPTRPGRVVALDHGDLREVARRVGDDARRRARVGSSSSASVISCIGHDARSRARARPATAPQRASGRAARDADALAHPVRHRGRRRTARRAVAADLAAVLEHGARRGTSRGRRAARSRRGSPARSRRGRQPVAASAGCSVASSSASSGAMPSATATRHIWSMWPSRSSKSGSRSSVQNAQSLRARSSRTSGSRSRRLRAFEASRISTHSAAPALLQRLLERRSPRGRSRCRRRGRRRGAAR